MHGKIKSRKGFYVGDICYVLSDEVYNGIWGNKGHYKDGTFDVPCETGRSDSTGRRFTVGSTAYGDGLYLDDEGREFPVDAGNIGLVPLELVENDVGSGFGTVVYTPGEATLRCKDGVFDITLPERFSIHIDTRDDF